MARRKKVPLNDWETWDPEKDSNFARIGFSLWLAPAFIALKPTARNVYLMMIGASAGKREFTFTNSYYTARGIVRKSFLRAVQELTKAGFIQIIENGKNTRTPSKYAFSNRWKQKE